MATSIRCGHCGQKHESVAAVRRCGQTGGHASSRVVQQTAVAKPAAATVGLYRKLGQIYAVDYLGGTGRLVASRLDRYVDADGHTAYRMVRVAKMASTLSQADRMDEGEAREFGRLTGTCVRCARKLDSRANAKAGVGRGCIKKI
jgi:hypothetical protein